MRFAVYVLRWMASALVMFPFMAVLPIDNQYLKLLVLQIIGACVFYNIDKLIFKGE